MKASKQFIVQRRWISYRRGRSVHVEVRSTARSTGQQMCLTQFRRTFGFTPRKGKTYRVTLSDFQVEEITS